MTNTTNTSDMETMWRKWKDWDTHLFNEVVGLHQCKSIYRSFLEIVKGRKGDLVWWIATNYGVAALMSIRRLTENKSKYGNLSLRVILKDMMENCNLITREHFFDDYSQRAERTPAVFYADQPTEALRAAVEKQGEGKLHARLDEDFDNLAGKGQDSLPKSTLEEHLKKVETIHSKIEYLVDKYLAHHDLKRENLGIKTFGELDRLVGETIEEYSFVRWVITGVTDGQLPQTNYDWGSLIRILQDGLPSVER